MKAQPVLYNYTILPNWENERASKQFNFYSWIPPSEPILASLVIGVPPPPLDPLKQNFNFFKSCMVLC